MKYVYGFKDTKTYNITFFEVVSTQASLMGTQTGYDPLYLLITNTGFVASMAINIMDLVKALYKSGSKTELDASDLLVIKDDTKNNTSAIHAFEKTYDDVSKTNSYTNTKKALLNSIKNFITEKTAECNTVINNTIIPDNNKVVYKLQLKAVNDLNAQLSLYTW